VRYIAAILRRPFALQSVEQTVLSSLRRPFALQSVEQTVLSSLRLFSCAQEDCSVNRLQAC
jgi:hypothetical protein